MNDATRRRPFSLRSEKAAFPDRTNPCRPPQTHDAARSKGQSADASYPTKCDPRKPKAPLNEDQRGLTVRYLPLARGLAGRAIRKWPVGRDEFPSAAFLALVEAAQSFDPSRNVDFSTYARYRIRGALLDVQRELISGGLRVRAEHTPQFQPLEADSETRGWVVGVQVGDPVGTDLEAADAVENWLEKIPKRHSAAFRHIYLDGKTQEEAAELVGCSKASMSRLHRETLDWFHQAGWPSTTPTAIKSKSSCTEPAKAEPTASVLANGRDRMTSSWASRPCLGVAG